MAAAAPLTLLPVSLGAQGRWTPPQLPCDVSAGHFRVNGGVLYLKTAADKPAQRESQLAQARRVLTEAIVQDKQDKNPAAWYYLGRYYAEAGDAAGADSAFARAVALAPQCREDIAGYEGQLWAATLNKGVEAWQGGKEDSAVVLFHLAARLRPANPKAFIALAGLYAGKERDDSAVVYYRAAAQAAGTDTAFARDRRDALSNVARIALSRAQSDPAMQRFQQARTGRDSLERAIVSDSTVLAKMEANSASRKRRGARLSPVDQQSFARDSAARAQSVAQERAAGRRSPSGARPTAPPSSPPARPPSPPTATTSRPIRTTSRPRAGLPRCTAKAAAPPRPARCSIRCSSTPRPSTRRSSSPPASVSSA